MQRQFDIHETIETPMENFIIQQDTAVRQLCNSQDHAASGSYSTADDARVYWSAVFDGHGMDDVIDAIRESDLDTIMQDLRPYDRLQENIDAKSQREGICLYEQYDSGSTFVYAKVTTYPDNTHIAITNIGDSKAMLFVNNALIFVSESHNYTNGKEMVRIISENRVDKRYPIKTSGAHFDVLSHNVVMSKRGHYVNFATRTGGIVPLSPTQTLGHKGITGIAPDTTVFIIHPTDVFKIILMSDGVSDIMPVDGFNCAEFMDMYRGAKSANEILDTAESRWKQQWTHYGTHDLRSAATCQIESNDYDDCSCVILQRKQR